MSTYSKWSPPLTLGFVVAVIGTRLVFAWIEGDWHDAGQYVGAVVGVYAACLALAWWNRRTRTRPAEIALEEAIERVRAEWNEQCCGNRNEDACESCRAFANVIRAFGGDP